MQISMSSSCRVSYGTDIPVVANVGNVGAVDDVVVVVVVIVVEVISGVGVTVADSFSTRDDDEEEEEDGGGGGGGDTLAVESARGRNGDTETSAVTSGSRIRGFDSCSTFMARGMASSDVVMVAGMVTEGTGGATCGSGTFSDILWEWE